MTITGQTCKICSGNSRSLGIANVLKRHSVAYFCCEVCGFVQTEAPYWLDEAYSHAITKTDIGLISRNIDFAYITQALVRLCLEPNSRSLDYGGGYGIFVRLMRDHGFDFYRYDKFAPNLFAVGFDAEDLNQTSGFELVTAFEVFEHFVQPQQEVAHLASMAGNIFFSTHLIAEPPPPFGNWWYYGLEHGQHVALYTRRTLTHLAQQHNLYYHMVTPNLHLFTRKHISPWRLRLIRYRQVAAMLALFLPRPSLTWKDYERMVETLDAAEPLADSVEKS